MIQPIETAPKNGTYILIFGDGGYINTPLRCEVCKYDPDYRLFGPWINYSGESFLDSGSPPLGWMPLPEITPEMWKKLSK